MKQKVLLTSAASKIPALRLLEEAVGKFANTDLLAGDSATQTVAAHSGFSYWQMPETTNANLEAILEGLTVRRVHLVIPTRDSELIFWAENRKAFEDIGTHIAISSLRGVQLCLDKLKFSEWGFSTAQPVIPASLSAEVSWDKIVVKERYGAGSKGVALNLSASEATKHSGSLTEPIFQPHVEGLEVSIDAWFRSTGVLHGFVMRTRDLVRNGESQITTTFRDRSLERQAKAVLDRMGWDLGLRGSVVMQGIVRERKLWVIEVNARLGGASSASAEVGLDLLFLSVAEVSTTEGGIPEFDRRPFEVRQVRAAVDRRYKLP